MLCWKVISGESFNSGGRASRAYEKMYGQVIVFFPRSMAVMSC